MTSHAANYAAAKARAAFARSEAARFAAGFEFELDDFQLQGCQALEAGRGVLVAAPTGAGKTVVGEFAVHLALARGVRVFYTTPIKALSNQKYADLVARYGAQKIGLLTGDSAINGDAPVVVMTTEVLRNMLYANSRAVDNLGFVIMDEVHYLADRFRGPVWEEVIIHLPDRVQIVSLSATVSNAEEFGQWLAEVRGDTEVVVSELRPVPLWQHMAVGTKLYDLYSHRASAKQNPLNPALLSAYTRAFPSVGRGGLRRAVGGRYQRSELVTELDNLGLLPAIVFVFSRAGCDAAVEQLLAAGVRLTNKSERALIDQHLQAAVASLPSADLAVVGFDSFAAALREGIAPHHAGLLPVFKETVERLFSAGAIKVVFATETLALGINMPARTVVIESLRKWDGSAHVQLSAGEYTQLTGRAGRRGIDVEGHAVVVARSETKPELVSQLASRRTYPLRSAFQPTFNMAVNLLSKLTREQARAVLRQSFAQFQADRSVVGVARQVRTHEQVMAEHADAMVCHLGDFGEYALLRQELADAEKAASRQRSLAVRKQAADSLRQARRGDVVQFRHARRESLGVVLAHTETREGDSLLQVVTEDARLKRLGLIECPAGVQVIGRVRVPRGTSGRRPQERRDLAAAARELRRSTALNKRQISAENDNRIEELRAQLRAHPCHGCGEREVHARRARQWVRARVERDRLLANVEARTGGIVGQFDQVCAVLQDFDYLDQAGQVTAAGQMLARIYGERDLLIAECLRAGIWEGLEAAELAAVISSCVFEARAQEMRPGPVPPRATVALKATAAKARQVAATCVSHGLQPPELIDDGIAHAVWRWAQGANLAQCLTQSEITPGDFVRWVKQVLDLLEQLVNAAPTPELSERAWQAVRALRRGVVAWSGL